MIRATSSKRTCSEGLILVFQKMRILGWVQAGWDGGRVVNFKPLSQHVRKDVDRNHKPPSKTTQWDT
jgi:hypothetical protein